MGREEEKPTKAYRMLAVFRAVLHRPACQSWESRDISHQNLQLSKLKNLSFVSIQILQTTQGFKSHFTFNS